MQVQVRPVIHLHYADLVPYMKPSEVVRNLTESRKLLEEARQDLRVRLGAHVATSLWRPKADPALFSASFRT